jgi:hypothetical protein
MSAVAAAAPRAQAPAPTMAGYPAVGARAIVTLVQPGAAPRTAMRYRVASTYKTSVDIVTTMDMAMNLGGMPMPMSMPATRMTIELAVTEVAANGDITYGLTFTQASLDASDGNPLAAAMQGSIAMLNGLKGTGTITSRGVTKSARLGTGETGDPALAQALTQVISTLQNLVMPFPEEAVGVDARWEVRTALESNGMHVFQKSTYELVSMSGPSVTLKVSSEQVAPPQAVSMPGMPPGVEATLEKFSGSGLGSYTFRLDGLAGTGEMESTNSTAVGVNMGGNPQSVSSELKIKVTIAPTPVK